MTVPCPRSSSPTAPPPSCPKANRWALCCHPRRSRPAWTASSSTSRSFPDRRGAEPVLPDDPDGLHVLRHSAAHVMAQAVCDRGPAPATRSARRSRTASTTTSSSRGRSPRATLRRSRTGCARSSRRINRSCARISRARGLRALRRPAVQARDHRVARGGEVPAGDTVTVYRNDGWRTAWVPTSRRLAG